MREKKKQNLPCFFAPPSFCLQCHLAFSDKSQAFPFSPHLKVGHTVSFLSCPDLAAFRGGQSLLPSVTCLKAEEEAVEEGSKSDCSRHQNDTCHLVSSIFNSFSSQQPIVLSLQIRVVFLQYVLNNGSRSKKVFRIRVSQLHYNMKRECSWSL